MKHTQKSFAKSKFSFLFLQRSVPGDILQVVGAQLDAFCKRTARRAKDKKAASGRFFWLRRGAAIILAEELSDGNGGLIRQDSGRFLYYAGEWHLYCVDVKGRWRRYALAPAARSFAVVFRHWQQDVTGIFRSPRMRKSTVAEIERDALAVLVGG